MTSNIRQQSNYILQGLYNRFLELVIYPSVWVASAIASLGMYVQIVLGLEADWRPILFIFFTALIPYNLDRIFDSYVQIIPDEKAQLFFRQPYILVLLFLAIASTILLLSDAPQNVRYASIPGIVPLLYGAPVFPFKQEQWQWYRLKDIPGSKAWIVGLTLTYASVALPLAYAGAKFNFSAALTTLFLFVFIVTNSHLFDIRDLESDRQKGVITLPITVGVKGTKLLLGTMNLLAMLTVIILSNGTVSDRPEIILATAINLFCIALVDFNTPRWVYGIILDGCLFVPLAAKWAIEFMI